MPALTPGRGPTPAAACAGHRRHQDRRLLHRRLRTPVKPGLRAQGRRYGKGCEPKVGVTKQADLLQTGRAIHAASSHRTPTKLILGGKPWQSAGQTKTSGATRVARHLRSLSKHRRPPGAGPAERKQKVLPRRSVTHSTAAQAAKRREQASTCVVAHLARTCQREKALPQDADKEKEKVRNTLAPPLAQRSWPIVKHDVASVASGIPGPSTPNHTISTPAPPPATAVTSAAPALPHHRHPPPGVRAPPPARHSVARWA